jgi:stage II sporulation protein D
MRRHAPAVLLPLLAVVSMPVIPAAGTVAGTAAVAQEPAGDEVVIEGKGWGHGVGMPQDGAYAMGMAGAGVGEILEAFYPGTSLGQRSASVRVDVLASPQASLVVAFPGGGQVAGDGPGFPVTVSAGGSVRLSVAGGGYRAVPLGGATAAPIPLEPSPSDAAVQAAPAAPATTTTAPSLLGLIRLPPPPTTAAAPPPTTAAPPPASAAAPAGSETIEPTSGSALQLLPSGGSSVAVSGGGSYRGAMQAVAHGGGLQLVNELDVEQYLRGMGEVLDPGWPAAALQAQAIVARTYALDAMAAGRGLCSTQQCQVYLGETAEYGAMNAAVAATAGQVLTYGGSLAEAVYSANAGGITATPEEGFGRAMGDYPYLRSAPYQTLDPMPWDLRLPLSQLAARVGYGGEASDVRISRAGPSGRALEVTVTGDAGDHTVEGLRFVEVLGLRSTLFTIDVPRVGATPTARSPAGRAERGRRSYALAAGDDEGLGRTPWAALSVLLLAAWGTAAAKSGRYPRLR